jgi:NADH:ubiquinone oxidoreductase subunit F (NADH-binding)
MDYDSIAKAGSMLGSGAVIVMDDTRCMVKSLLNGSSYFYHEESCGQCTPCREGTGWLYRMVDRIEHGQGRHGRFGLCSIRWQTISKAARFAHLVMLLQCLCGHLSSIS